MTGRACVSDGSCAYEQHAPRTCAGWQAWDVLRRCAGQLRIAGSRPVGLDLGVAMTLGDALGYDRAALAELLPAGEAGMISGLLGELNEDG